MKTHIKKLFLLSLLIAGLGSIPVGRAAQAFTTLHNFTEVSCEFCPNSDGALPNAGLIANLSGNTLYGTAPYGGASGYGTVFAVKTDGSGFTNLHSFNYSDGTTPYAGLLLSGNTLYGTAKGGGSSGRGTMFVVNTDGSGFTNLHTFTGGDGSYLRAELILSGKTLYGTAAGGGLGNNGTVFAVNTDGSGFTNLHSFTGGSEGANPQGRLILSGNTLYGTTVSGGSPGYGTVFSVNTNGTGFTNLHSFAGSGYEGSSPYACLILSGNTLYGTASYGGNAGGGTVFKINTDGAGFTKLHSFNYDYDGANPGDLILSGHTLYGLATSGGSSGNGTVFAVNTNGTGFKNLYNFTGGDDGAGPQSGLILLGNTLYGTAQYGGSSGGGTVFSLSLPPLLLTIMPYLGDVILTWPADAVGVDNTGFTLQYSTNLVSPVVWGTVSPGPIVIGGQNVVINPISGLQRFYRLSQ